MVAADKFDRASFSQRFLELPSCALDYIFSRLSDSDLEVASRDPYIRNADDYLILAQMKDMKPEEFAARAEISPLPEFEEHFREFSRHWTLDATFYAGRDLHAVTGRQLEDVEFRNASVNRVLQEGKRARVFYGMKYPEKMDRKYEEPVNTPEMNLTPVFLAVA